MRSTKGQRIAMFQDTASTPSTMAVARSAIAVSMLTEAAVVLQSDCPSAYIQSLYEGPLTYVRLPEEWWPPEWKSMSDPVCKLLRNLYGHPTAGHGWPNHLEKQL